MSVRHLFLRPGRTALLCVALAARTASAQGTTPAQAPSVAALADSLTGTAKADYGSARILYDDGDFRGALQKLKTAYDASRDPRLLWDMAACEKNLRHYAEVLRLVERYLAEGGTLVTERDRTEATELAHAVTSFVTELTVEVDQPDATISFDDGQLGKSPLTGPVRVDMGQHKIRVTKPGFADFSTTPELPGGQPFHVSAKLVAEHHVGRLRVLAGPSDVIQVDQHTVGTGLWEGELASGAHSVYVSAKGKRAHQTDVLVQDGNVSTLHVTLQDEPKNVAVEKGGVPTWVWIAGSAVLVAGASVGAYFLLKPEDPNKYQAPTPGTWGTLNI